MADFVAPPFTAAEFYQHLAQHKLVGSRNITSGKLYVPPRPMCPESKTTDMELVEVSGKGKLVAFSVITIAPTPMIEAGYNRNNPYCAGVVELEEGPKVSAQILGVDVSKPQSIKIGTPVKVAFVERGEGEKQRTYLAFEPV
jgi:uncharacterized OB-fold protein